jgi:hypothetical protein
VSWHHNLFIERINTAVGPPCNIGQNRKTYTQVYLSIKRLRRLTDVNQRNNSFSAKKSVFKNLARNIRQG